MLLSAVLLALLATSASAVPHYPSQVRLLDDVALLEPAFTPDGQTAVFVGSTAPGRGFHTLYSLDLGDPSSQPVQLGDGLRNADDQGVEITADGRDVVYRGETFGGGLWSVPVDGSTAPVPLARGDDHLVSQFTLHPDGTHVVFMDAPDVPDTPYDLWVRRIDGADEPRRINSRQQERGGVHGFQLTPDGDHAVFSGDLENYGRDDVYAAPVFGDGDQARVHPVPPEDGFVTSWDVAGDHVLVLGDMRTRSDREVFSTPVDGSGPTTVLVPSDGRSQVSSIEPTPDGTRVVYVATAGGEQGNTAYVSPVHARSPRRLATLGNEGRFALDVLVTPDSQRAVLMTSPEPGRSEDLWSVRLDGRDGLVRLTDPGTLDALHLVMGRDVRVTPDSQRVLWARDNGLYVQRVGLFSAPVDRPGDQVLLSAGDRYLQPVAFEPSPDGTRVAFLARTESRDPDAPHHTPLFSAPVDRAGERVLVSEMAFTDETGGAFRPGFSPDSATLFYGGTLEDSTARSYASSVGQQVARQVTQLAVTSTGTSSARVTWDDPALGSRTTGFELDVSPSVPDTPTTLAATAREATLTDLQPDTTYTVTVRAANEAGTGAATSVEFVSTGDADPEDRPVDVVRLAGAGRYATASDIARHTHPDGADEVVLALGDDFPDALAAVPLAVASDAPLLLTDGEALPGPTAHALRELAPTRVTVVGGPAAVTDAVLDDVRAVTGAGIRRLSGPNRFATARAVADELPDARALFVATGLDFPDALAGGAVSDGAPLVLVAPDRVPPATSGLLRDRAVDRLVVLGGEAAVTGETLDDLADLSSTSPERIAGANRHETAASLARTRRQSTTAYVATGSAFPDALAGGPAAALEAAPVLLLAGDGTVPEATASALADMPNLDEVVVLGGTSAVPEAAVDALRRLLAGS